MHTDKPVKLLALTIFPLENQCKKYWFFCCQIFNQTNDRIFVTDAKFELLFS